MEKRHVGLIMSTDTRWMAGIIYIQNLIRAIDSLPENERETVFLSLIVYDSKNSLVTSMSGLVDQIVEMPLWEKVRQVIKKKLSINFSFFDYLFFNQHQFDFIYPYDGSEEAPFSWGGWIPDFQHLHLPAFFSNTEIQLRENYYGKIARNAPRIVLSSKMAQNDFAKRYPEKKDQTRVMHFVSCPEEGWFNGDPAGVQKKYRLPDRFFLISNQFWKHKGHPTALEALKILRDKNIRPHIVFTGATEDHRNPEYFQSITKRIKEFDLENQVSILGLIPRIDQIQLMRRSLAVIQPSLFEGWSTVVEDARLLGKFIILSDFPVHLEQNPPHSAYFKQGDAESLAEKIETHYHDLIPGPDMANETQALDDHNNRKLAFGRKFLEIVSNTDKA